jgi:hypothetical protein
MAVVAGDLALGALDTGSDVEAELRESALVPTAIEVGSQWRRSRRGMGRRRPRSSVGGDTASEKGSGVS